jgi:4-hydroxy-3-methylbut-2-enyl diphosphate reductase
LLTRTFFAKYVPLRLKNFAMHININRQSGFCFGVIRAIEKAERALSEGVELLSLGEIVHNNAEVNRLKTRGLRIISHSEFENISNATVLIRAHGEPPKTYDTAHKNNICLIDATCPVVLKLQEKIRESNQNKSADAQILIFGQKGHAEVNGLVGQADGDAQVIETIADIVDWTRPIILFSQTTKSEDSFCQLCTAIRSRLPARLHFEAHNTICRYVSGRVQHLRTFAARHDVVVFVSGALSSNGSVLYSVCRSVNARTYRAENALDLQSVWFNGCRLAGVCGATSTPQWLMEEVAEAIQKLTVQ